ncbi:MAG TPA: hypothetical protein VHQ66_12820 [Myxococcota bacterium]|nr:hypothetical protein [Myxococcota bacterium]
MSRRRRQRVEPARRAEAARAARRDAPRPGAAQPPRASEPRRATLRFTALFAACAALVLVALGPALSGPFVSDDLHYVPNNPYVTRFSADVLGEVLDPRGEPVAITENYTPVHLLLHAFAWRLFGDDVRGHHAFNLLLHALASALLAPLLLRSGVPRPGALGASLLFLLHPANVEAAAWINQVKSTASVSLAILALLALERRPALGTLCFALALLAKPTSAFVLPAAAVFTWTRQRGPEARRTYAWLGLWALLFAAYAVIEMTAFTRAVAGVAPVHPDPLVRLRTSVGFVARYFAMATTSYGVSAFHEPSPALSWLDPWWLAGLAIVGVLGARTALMLRARREEAGYWVWAAAAFLPVAQVWPFPFPLADRYLYPILPGLIGGFALALAAPAARLLAGRTRAAYAAGAVALAVLALFAARAHARANLWAIPARLAADSAANYPEGVNANLLRATRAMQVGDRRAAIDALRGAAARGYERFDQILGNPGFAPLQGDPAFDAVIAAMAGRWIERLGARTHLAQSELLSLAVAHRLRGEREQARRAIERGLARDGPLRPALERELRLLGSG